MGKNAIYNRVAAARYAEKYAETYNKEYPNYLKFDCTNFVSQVLEAGGIPYVGSMWELHTSWFCNTINHEELTKVAISWRAGRYFRRHWGNENGLGNNRSKEYIETTTKEFKMNFEKYFNMLNIGDVIQYGAINNNGYPFHTQVIHKKRYNRNNSRKDLFMAQHSYNKKNISLYDLLDTFKTAFIYIYIIK